MKHDIQNANRQYPEITDLFKLVWSVIIEQAWLLLENCRVEFSQTMRPYICLCRWLFALSQIAPYYDAAINYKLVWVA